MKPLPLVLALLSLSACAGPRSTAEVRDSGSLEMLKRLAGSWVALDEQGKPTEQVTNVFRVTAGGSAVEETVFPGTEHEMVTLYFVRDGRLQLTHYCMAGNQPHMLAQPVKATNELEFVCDGSGVESEDEGHMHHARLVLGTDGTLSTRWQMIEQGKDTHLAEFRLARKN